MRGIEAAFFGMVGKPAELKTSRAGKPFASFSVGTDAGEDKDGKAVLEWVRVTMFGDLATQLAPKLDKGVRIYAEGRLTLDRWTDKDGAARVGLSLAAFKVERVGASALGRNRTRGEAGPREFRADGKSTPRERAANWQAPPTGAFDQTIGDPLDL